MKRILFVVCVFVLLCSVVQAQTIMRTLTWDKSADDTRDDSVANPVKYRVYSCADLTLLECTNQDAGTALEQSVQLQTGTKYWFVRAYWFSLTVDGVPSSDILESGNSNVLKVEVHVPPGNPANAKVKVTNVAQTISGQTAKVRKS